MVKNRGQGHNQQDTDRHPPVIVIEGGRGRQDNRFDDSHAFTSLLGHPYPERRIIAIFIQRTTFVNSHMDYFALKQFTVPWF